MKITVLGCGAMGQLWLTALNQKNHHVQGWLRVPQPYCSVNLMTLHGQPINLSLTSNDPDFLRQSDLLLVTLKAWQVSPAVKSLASHLSPHTPVLLLHNGMGTLPELRVFPNPLLVGVTTQAARHDENVVLHVATGTTHIGPGNEAGRDFSQIAEILHDALPDVAWHDDINAARWAKLAANCAINPLTVIYNCPNGELLNHQQEVKAICQEVALVMDREGHHTAPDVLLQYVIQVIESTAQNISSMLQDIRMQRHTEIDYITGYLLQRARAHGLSLPINSQLYEQVKRKENNYERIGADMSGPWQ